MMKAYNICLFLVLLNACVWMFDGLGIWAAGDGQLLSGDESGLDNANMVDNPGFSAIAGVGSPVTLSLIILGVIIGGMAGIASRITTPQVVGIVAFSTIFWAAYGGSVGILSSIFVPDSFIMVFTAINWFVFVIGVIQMATGMAMRGAE